MKNARRGSLQEKKRKIQINSTATPDESSLQPLDSSVCCRCGLRPGARRPLSVVDENQKVVGALSVVGAKTMSKFHNNVLKNLPKLKILLPYFTKFRGILKNLTCSTTLIERFLKFRGHFIKIGAKNDGVDQKLRLKVQTAIFVIF